MLPRTIQTVMSVVAAGIVAHPLSTVVHVGSIGVSFPIVEMSVFFRRMRSGYPRRAVFGDVLASATNLLPPSTLMAFVLGQRGKAKHET
jgi:hypothetical protein